MTITRELRTTQPLDAQERQFRAEVEQWVLDCISQGTQRFGELLLELPGVYPPVVLETLAMLADAGTISTKIRDDAYRESQQIPDRYTESCHTIKFPAPHPLDYDWRFSTPSIDYLLGKACSVTAQNDMIALLGVPSLLRAAIERGFGRSRLCLLDANATVLSAFPPGVDVRRCEVGRDELPDLQGHVVISDPPWYEEHIRLFLWAACQICAVGGYIFLVVPPIGARPSVPGERQRLLHYAQTCGLDVLVDHERSAVRYVTPIFEYNALKAAGILNVPFNWRSGDLLVFRRNRSLHSEMPSFAAESATWTEHVIDGIRIRVQAERQADFQDPSLIPIVPETDDILPTVSRRDSRRGEVQVWTSGNRVFASRGAYILDLILEAMAAGQPVPPHVECALSRNLAPRERHLICKVMDRIRSLVAIEKAEQTQFICDSSMPEPVVPCD